MALTRELMAIKVSREELYDGITANLGAGMPALVYNYLPPDIEVLLQAENGVLGYNGAPELDEIDRDVMNAAGFYVTLLPGGSFFPSHVSFHMITGGHVDVGILGGLQVSERGDLANWIVPERRFWQHWWSDECGSGGEKTNCNDGAHRSCWSAQDC